MYGRILQCCIFTLLYLNIFSDNRQKNILFKEFGVHIDGEQVSYVYKGIIPAFTPNYNLNVTPHRPGMETRFTFLRVEYINGLSKVVIEFSPATCLMTFHIKFPFVDTPIGVVGYSMPIIVEPSNIHHEINGVIVVKT